MSSNMKNSVSGHTWSSLKHQPHGSGILLIDPTGLLGDKEEHNKGSSLSQTLRNGVASRSSKGLICQARCVQKVSVLIPSLIKLKSQTCGVPKIFQLS